MIILKIDPKSFKYSESKRNNSLSVMDPLMIREVTEELYSFEPDPVRNKFRRKLFNKFKWYRERYTRKYGGSMSVRVTKTIDISEPKLQSLVLNMAMSGDFTLKESLYAVANACDRCRNALIFKYCPGNRGFGGYSEDSNEYQKRNCRCRFCSPNKWY